MKQELSVAWHTMDVELVLAELATLREGMSVAEAKERLDKFGMNDIEDRGQRSIWRILWEQVSAVLVLVLIGAALIAGMVGAVKDMSAILVVVVLFVFIGFFQDYRAEKAVAALKRLTVPLVKVFRGGRLTEVSSRELVPGDIIQIETGNVIAADCRLISAINLKVQEAALTGESEAIEKTVSVIDKKDASLGDRLNMVYRGTVVSIGRGSAVVTSTGMSTELGKIASMLQKVKHQPTPLQRKLDELGKVLSLVGVGVAAVIFFMGLLIGNTITHMLLTAVSVAVAVVPEGLPAALTITLALGAQRMLKRRALIRKLPAVETLGSVTVICSDKTGTLTQNKMTVVAADLIGGQVALDDPGSFKGSSFDPQVQLMFSAAALCSDVVSQSCDDQCLMGDPTECALIKAAHKVGIDTIDLLEVAPRDAEVPFDSVRKRMTTVHSSAYFIKQGLLADFNAPYVAFTKGSVDGLVDISCSALINGKMTTVTSELRKKILDANNALAAKGMRVLGVACRALHDNKLIKADLVETGLTFIGMVAMIDPPRAEAKDAVRVCREAGIRPIMITGDHLLTAKYIAREIGILSGETVVAGAEIDQMSVAQLDEAVRTVSVFARVSPEHKLRIVESLKKNGEIVAMTGDGVNDAPALKKADIGVAMGQTGTDVSKEAANMVLLDDNFTTIVAAVEEGRTIYDNIKKFVKFSVAGNVGKIFVMLLAPALGQAIPLIPLQILWLNLLTDGLLCLGMGVEPTEKGVMKRKPFPSNDNIFSGGGARHVIEIGVLIGVVSLSLGAWYFFQGLPQWQTVLFTAIAFSQIGQALAMRSNAESFFHIGFFSNRVMASMIILVLFLQIIGIYSPLMQKFLMTKPLSAVDLMICMLAGGIIFTYIEMRKSMRRRRSSVHSCIVCQ